MLSLFGPRLHGALMFHDGRIFKHLIEHPPDVQVDRSSGCPYGHFISVHQLLGHVHDLLVQFVMGSQMVDQPDTKGFLGLNDLSGLGPVRSDHDVGKQSQNHSQARGRTIDGRHDGLLHFQDVDKNVPGFGECLIYSHLIDGKAFLEVGSCAEAASGFP